MWCKKLDSDTFTDSRVIKLAEQFVTVKIDKDKHASVAKKFRVRGLPTVVFADAKGRPVGKIIGYAPPDRFLQDMEKIARVNRELPQLEATFEADPSDLATGGLLASVYAFRGKASRARKCIKVVEDTDPDNEQGHLTAAYSAMGEYYDEREEFRKAVKFYAKAAATGKNPPVVADARYSAARAHLRDGDRFEPGSKGAEKRLQAAEAELTALLAMADAPPELKQSAEELMKTVEQQKTEHEKRKQEAKKQREQERKNKKRGGRR